MAATIALTDALRAEYGRLFDNCVIRPQYQAYIDAAARKMITNKARYQSVSAQCGVPWTVIAVNHELECGQDFHKHLHNGDPLDRKTVHVPAGRPPGPGPWTWEESALDALGEYARWKDWSVAGTLYMLERYNGMGYRQYHPAVPSPYLWSYSTWYTAGKYAADGTWSPTLVSKQPGCAVLLRRLSELGASGFADQQTAGAGQPLVVQYMVAKPTDPALIARATALQTWLNTHAGIFVRPDGWAGEKTSDAYALVTGHHLPGDPRG